MPSDTKNVRKKKKPGFRVGLIIALTVILIVTASSALGLFIFRDSVFLALAKSCAEEHSYSEAAQWAQRSEHEHADELSDYVDLRLQINEKYPLIVSEFDIIQIKEWHSEAQALSGCEDELGEELCTQVKKLADELSVIVRYEEEYTAIQADILSLMDVFNEINRLHTKDADGKNITFTIQQERNKIAYWQGLSDKVLEFISGVPSSENLYLINYMAKESQGEIAEITDAIDTVAASGYSDTDIVRFSGDAEKKFPDITNGDSEKVNLLDKAAYEAYMYDEFCSHLIENISIFYINNN